MTPREWLDHLATLMVDRSPKIKTRLMAFHGGLKTAVPARFLTPDTAKAVEPMLPAIPSYEELLSVVRQVGDRVAGGTSRRFEESATEEEKWDQRWFDYANRRLAEQGEERLGHLLSLLRAQSFKAWLRFADIHAPDVARAHREIQQEIADRRAGLLPQFPKPPAVRLHPPAAFKRSHAEIPTAAPVQQRVIPSEALNRQLRAAAISGDQKAADTLFQRTRERVVVPQRVIEHEPEVGMDERDFAPFLEEEHV
jgi:hypothetical protein